MQFGLINAFKFEFIASTQHVLFTQMNEWMDECDKITSLRVLSGQKESENMLSSRANDELMICARNFQRNEKNNRATSIKVNKTR